MRLDQTCRGYFPNGYFDISTPHSFTQYSFNCYLPNSTSGSSFSASVRDANPHFHRPSTSGGLQHLEAHRSADGKYGRHSSECSSCIASFVFSQWNRLEQQSTSPLQVRTTHEVMQLPGYGPCRRPTSSSFRQALVNSPTIRA